MSSLKKRKGKASRIGWRSHAEVPKDRARPTPVQGIANRHEKQARWLAAREDRFSQLLSRILSDEVKGQYLVSKGNLSAEEHAELLSLAPQANAALSVELRDAISHLRSLLALGDPIFMASIVQLPNLFGPWGTYYEPTHEGSEAKVELVVGLLTTQPASGSSDPPSAEDLKA